MIQSGVDDLPEQRAQCRQIGNVSGKAGPGISPRERGPLRAASMPERRLRKLASPPLPTARLVWHHRPFGFPPSAGLTDRISPVAGAGEVTVLGPGAVLMTRPWCRSASLSTRRGRVNQLFHDFARAGRIVDNDGHSARDLWMGRVWSDAEAPFWATRFRRWSLARAGPDRSAHAAPHDLHHFLGVRPGLARLDRPGQAAGDVILHQQ